MTTGKMQISEAKQDMSLISVGFRIDDFYTMS